MIKTIIFEGNGSTDNKNKNKNKDHIVDILATDKNKAIEILQRAQERIQEFRIRLENAYTTAEKDIINEKIQQLDFNYKVLKDKFEKNHGDPKTNKDGDVVTLNIDPIGDLEDIPSNFIVTEKDIDNNTRKVGSYGRSYDSGFKGYTKKEAAAIRKLIPDIHKPVKLTSKPNDTTNTKKNPTT